MSPESQELESFFQKINAAEAPFREGLPSHPTSQNFDKFFENLSSIDDLVLDEGVSAKPSAEPSPKPAQPERQKQAPMPRMNGAVKKMRIFRSDRAESAGFEFGPSEGAPAEIRGGMIGRKTAAFIKVAAAGILLFGVGLGSGWAALSLPERLDDRMAAFTNRFKATKAMMEKAPSRVEFASSASAGNEAAAAEEVTPIVTTPPEKGAALAKNKGQVAAMELPAADMFSEKKIVEKLAAPVKADRKRVVAGKNAAPARPGQDAAPRQFAVQVGACQSSNCVSSYRKLLLPHVAPGAIQVLESAAPEGGGSVQRIRVVSLTESDARRLQKNLAASDARLKDSYTIAVNQSPSG